MMRLTKQGVRDLNQAGGPHRGRAVSALDRCLAAQTHRLRFEHNDYDVWRGRDTETWRCHACGTVDVRVIERFELDF